MSGSMKDLLGDTPASEYIPAFQAHSFTSREAAHFIAPRVNSLKQRVLDYFKANPNGATDEQLMDALNIKDSTLRPRRVELVNDGLVIDSKRYALNKSLRRATVWVIA